MTSSIQKSIDYQGILHRLKQQELSESELDKAHHLANYQALLRRIFEEEE